VIESFTTNREVRRLAKNLLAQAVANEPKITADLQTIAREVSAEMVGLENKFKSEMSLIRKLIDMANINAQTLEEVGEIINDGLRYTFVLPFEIYAEGFRETINRLYKIGCQIPAHRVWNTWKIVGIRRDRGYRGINITVLSSQKQIFELQFHTSESYRFKTETHDLYKEARNRETLPERRNEIREEFIKKAKEILIPKGVR